MSWLFFQTSLIKIKNNILNDKDEINYLLSSSVDSDVNEDIYIYIHKVLLSYVNKIKTN